jgi:CheY-like chemotaxis protein
MSTRRVLSVGQCTADHGRISSTLHATFAAEVVGADTAAEALDRLRQEAFSLVLVNRVFDADSDSGVAFIRQMKADPAAAGTPVMLVSNYADAQAEAAAAGAEPGFGKAALRAPETVARLKPHLA